MNKDVEDYEQRIISNVEKYGVSMTSVFGTEEKPPFTYTIGLKKTYNMPELIVFGLDPQSAHGVLYAAIGLIKQGNFDFDALHSQIIEGFQCAFKNVPFEIAKKYAYSASWFYNNERYEMSQLIWPDEAGKFPWDDGFNNKFKKIQPVLFNNIVNSQVSEEEQVRMAFYTRTCARLNKSIIKCRDRIREIEDIPLDTPQRKRVFTQAMNLHHQSITTYITFCKSNGLEIEK